VSDVLNGCGRPTYLADSTSPRCGAESGFYCMACSARLAAELRETQAVLRETALSADARAAEARIHQANDRHRADNEAAIACALGDPLLPPSHLEPRARLLKLERDEALAKARQYERAYDCHGGPGTATEACEACVTCLSRRNEFLAEQRGIGSVVSIRCLPHRDVPAYNHNESDGGECAACAVEEAVTPSLPWPPGSGIAVVQMDGAVTDLDGKKLEHLTDGHPCWCDPEVRPDGVVIHREEQ
jgi:hypothetical protein